jgi:hypothetical protein
MQTFRIAILAGVIGIAATVAHADPAHAYRTEAGAQKYCAGDEVVYGRSKNGGVYHLKGSPYYGHLAGGRYACRKEADAGGWRQSKEH